MESYADIKNPHYPRSIAKPYTDMFRAASYFERPLSSTDVLRKPELRPVLHSLESSSKAYNVDFAH